MLLSIIIPVYNVELYLKECIDSVIKQDIENYEIICINDGSTDESFRILKNYSEKYNFIKVLNQKNKGLSETRNVGLFKASGEFIIFLDSDDFIKENSLKDLIKIIKENKLEVLAYNYINYYNKKKYFIEDRKITQNKTMTGIEYYKEMSKDKSCPMSWLNIYRKDFLIANGLKFCEGIIHEDVEFMIRMLPKVKKMQYINNPIYYYRKRSGSIMNSERFNPKKRESFEKIIKTCGKEKKKIKDKELEKILDCRISTSTFSILKEELKEKYIERKKNKFTLKNLEKKRLIIRKSTSLKLKYVSNNKILFYSMVYFYLVKFKTYNMLGKLK